MKRSEEILGMEQGQWQWMMGWCKTKGVSPANEHMWNKAKEEYEKVKKIDDRLLWNPSE